MKLETETLIEPERLAAYPKSEGADAEEWFFNEERIWKIEREEDHIPEEILYFVLDLKSPVVEEGA